MNLKFKTSFGSLLDSDPRISLLTYSILLRIPWLLPHDMSYLGLPAIVEAFKRAGTRMTSHPLILDIGANNGISSQAFLKLLPGVECDCS